MTDEHALREAHRYVENLRGFYIHLFVFIAVMSLLFGINYATQTPWWAHWPLLGWGAGVLGHAVALFSPVSILGSDWQKRKVAERLARQRQAPPASQ